MKGPWAVVRGFFQRANPTMQVICIVNEYITPEYCWRAWNFTANDVVYQERRPTVTTFWIRRPPAHLLAPRDLSAPLVTLNDEPLVLPSE